MKLAPVRIVVTNPPARLVLYLADGSEGASWEVPNNPPYFAPGDSMEATIIVNFALGSDAN